ncbi:MAG: hypothetical protein ACR2P0_09815 [Acidimicrobiales bacterium]
MSDLTDETREIAVAHAHSRTDAERETPWHFWVIVVALAGYLLWRLIVGVGWLLG